MTFGTPLQGDQQTVDSWKTNPLNPHRIRNSRLADEVEQFRELEVQAEQDPELKRAFRAARALAEDLQVARMQFCMAAPPGTRIEQEMVALERLAPWGGNPDFDRDAYLRVLAADETALERARADYLQALKDAYKVYAAAFRAL